MDYYYLLGVAENASYTEIKQAYRRMAEIYHPDKLSQLPAGSRAEGEEIMRLLNDAKSVLLDPVQRQYYDMRVGVRKGSVPEEAIIIEMDEEERIEAIEIEPVRRKMNRVISTMRDVFSGDEEFSEKLEVAQEIVEARVIDGKRPRVTVEEDADDIVDTRGVEMRLEFTVVNEGEGAPEPSKKAKKGFKVLAVEGDEDDAVEVDWEEG
ncbi:MAG: DnaJ domain-containing protein [Candidatus Thermoplasmatota archaeon]|nr:DnaJ domain-containing protein [Candidatus Thermoplasmatota archaeon]